MEYQPKNFDHLFGLTGFSDQLLKNHFTLYQGYVTNANKLSARFKELREANQMSTPEYAELKRRFGWEFNGMRLHELYFGNMSKEQRTISDSLKNKLAQEFGSYEQWEHDFKATGAMRGIGWTILAYDLAAELLFNIWINEHDVGHLAGAVPLLVLDVFEHAYMLDYGLKKADYIAAFMSAVHWEMVEKRLQSP
jgi:Fe-Mn family superoxide dismutase